MIRVLHVIGIMNRGGAETMIMNLYRKMDRNRVQFDFVVHTDEVAIYDEEILGYGGKIYHCPKFRFGNIIKYIKWWNKFFKQHNDEYKIVHGHIGSTAAIYLKIAKKFNKFTIAHSHSAGNEFNLKQILYNIISYNTRFIADYFIACSLNSGISRFGKKVCKDRSRFLILNNAIDVDQFKYDVNIRKKLRSQLKVDNKIVIGHVGRFTYEKNHKFIIDIFKEYKKVHQDSSLLLVGDGPMRQEMEDYAKSLNLSDSITFMGVQTNVNELMQAFDLLLFPSIYEGLPVTLVEAQSASLPCLISNTVSKESILNDKLVSMLSLEEPISEWIKNMDNLLSIKREYNVEDIKNKGFDINETAKQMRCFYESI